MVQLFIHDVLRNDVMPVGQITDYFYRVEFQQRGSPHIHMLIWVHDAPKYDADAQEYDDIIKYVDKHITCAKDQNIESLIKLQSHRHTFTCRKSKTDACRFGFPKPPMSKTMLLKPYLAESDKEAKKLKRDHCTIKRICMDGSKVRKRADKGKFRAVV